MSADAVLASARQSAVIRAIMLLMKSEAQSVMQWARLCETHVHQPQSYYLMAYSRIQSIDCISGMQSIGSLPAGCKSFPGHTFDQVPGRVCDPGH